MPSVAVPPPVALAPTEGATDAVVHIAVDYDGAWLEGRDRVDTGGWRRLCAAPCDSALRVQGLEVRVTAPKMTTSNAFLVDPGVGVARFRVAGGSAQARLFGIIGLAAGLPVTFAGGTLFGLGAVNGDHGEHTAGAITLGVGAVMVAVALPLLLVGSTAVRNGEHRTVAKAPRGALY